MITRVRLLPQNDAARSSLVLHVMLILRTENSCAEERAEVAPYMRTV
jgi:hypothetical protein